MRPLHGGPATEHAADRVILGQMSTTPNQRGEFGRMSELFDRAKDAAQKAGEMAKDRSDGIQTGIDKAGDLADKATGGRFTDQVDAVRDKAHGAVEQLDGPQEGPTPLTDPGR